MAQTNICIFGDSVTWGPYLSFRVAWANLLRNHLERNATDLFRVYDLGIDMDTTKDVLTRMEAEANARKPGIIILAIGVNDSLYRHTPSNLETGLDEFEHNIQKLIEIAKKYTQKIMIVGLVKGSDKWTTPLIQSSTGKIYTKERTRQYDQKLREIARGNNIPFADVNGVLGEDDFDDGLHPNESGHIKMFRVISKELDPILGIKHEQRVTLVDENDRVIGQKLADAVEHQDITRVSALWIENESGEVLLAKRPLAKRRDPNRWGPTVATAVMENESYLAAIKNAAEHEIGLIDFELQTVEKVRVAGENNFFCQLFYVKEDLDLTKLKLNEEEVQKIEWKNKAELKKMYDADPQFFVQSFGDYLSVFE